jgi:hypothetical protein
MKKVWVFLLFLLLCSSLVYAGTASEYAERTGGILLKIQDFLLGALSFISLGAFSGGGTFAFAQFLFMTLLFLLIYEIVELVPFLSYKMNFPVALVVTILAFITIDANQIQMMLLSYESMGVIITVILPVLILLSFTFSMYKRAYEGKGDKSPFYAEMFNLVFLVFFGIFFIKYSSSEEAPIAFMRFVSGWVLIGLGIAQTIIYKLFANIFSKFKSDSENAKRERAAIKRNAADKINQMNAGI